MKKNMKPVCQTSVENSGPLAHPGKEPPQKGNGERRGKAYAQAGHPYQPHAFPRLPKPAGMEAHPHLGGAHQAGIGGDAAANAELRTTPFTPSA